MDQMEQVPLSPERERKTLPDLPAVASSEGDKDRVVVPPPPSEHQTPLTETEEQVQKKNVRWNEVLIDESKSSPLPAKVETVPVEEEEKSNPYVTRTSPPQSAGAKLDRVKSVLRRWGKRVGETAKKTEDLAGNTWQHLRTGPSFADAAMGRIAQTSKVIAEGGYEKIFKSTFETSPDEILKKTFACYLSTSAGPVMGVLYLSTAKLGFCSDNPLSYKNGDNETTAYSYYKVVIPINQLRSVDPSVSEGKPVEKYIQVVSVDNHEFWFLGFVNYDGAIKNIQQLLHHSNIP